MKKGDKDDESVVTGEIVFDKDAKSFSGATVFVRLENVSYADAAANVVAERVLHNVSHREGSNSKLKFELPVQDVDPKASYNVRVHVDVDGDKQISAGDYISMESYPVLTFDYPREVSVHVHEVNS